MCEHKWVYQMSDYKCEKEGYYIKKFSRIDTYYCEKCCEVKEKNSKGRNKRYKSGCALLVEIKETSVKKSMKMILLK